VDGLEQAPGEPVGEAGLAQAHDQRVGLVHRRSPAWLLAFLLGYSAEHLFQYLTIAAGDQEFVIWPAAKAVMKFAAKICQCCAQTQADYASFAAAGVPNRCKANSGNGCVSY